MVEPEDGHVSRRRLLKWGLGGATVIILGVAGGAELVDHGVLPGKQLLDTIDGACSVSTAPESFAKPGPSYEGEFYSSARHRNVGYTLAYPPGHNRGDALPLVVYLHGFGANHLSPYGNLTLAQALALRNVTGLLTPMAMVAPDGGNGYWHAIGGDDPMSMVVSELVPLCQRLGLGLSKHKIAATGISMGGYGALLLAEKHPDLISAVSSISPAIWTSWPEAHGANPTAYASPADFDANDVVTHTGALAGKPVRVASGYDDPFHPGVVALANSLPSGALVDFSQGCHTGPFFAEQAPLSMDFLSAHLTSS